MRFDFHSIMFLCNGIPISDPELHHVISHFHGIPTRKWEFLSRRVFAPCILVTELRLVINLIIIRKSLYRVDVEVGSSKSTWVDLGLSSRSVKASPLRFSGTVGITRSHFKST